MAVSLNGSPGTTTITETVTTITKGLGLGSGSEPPANDANDISDTDSGYGSDTQGSSDAETRGLLASLLAKLLGKESESESGGNGGSESSKEAAETGLLAAILAKLLGKDSETENESDFSTAPPGVTSDGKNTFNPQAMSTSELKNARKADLTGEQRSALSEEINNRASNAVPNRTTEQLQDALTKPLPTPVIEATKAELDKRGVEHGDGIPSDQGMKKFYAAGGSDDMVKS